MDTIISTIRSVQSQTFTDWEMVVVDDGSTDAGPERVRAFAMADSRIRVYTQKNQGVSAARNRGIELAHSDLIAFLDADDEWRPGFLEAVVALARDCPQAAWYATGYQIRHPRDGVFNARLRGVTRGFSRGLLPDYFVVAVQSDPPVGSSAVAVQRRAIEAIGGFPQGIASGEDLLTWARLAVRYPLAYDARPLTVFHVSDHDRRADPQQRVSEALEELLVTHPDVIGLKTYLGLWYRIQAVMAMRFGDAALARQCASRSVQMGLRQWRNSYTLLLSWLPTSCRRAVDGAARRVAACVRLS